MIRKTLFALLFAATPALAEDVALVVGNGSYQNARGLWGADDMADTSEAFEAAGFEVFTGENLDAEALRDLAAEFEKAADGSGRIAIALAGHFVQSESGAWFLGTDTDAPDLISAGVEGLPLSVLYEIAARAPGRAVVLLGTEDRSITLGSGLARGTGALQVPQGVAVIRGDASDLADFAEGDLLEPGATIASALARNSGLTPQGFITDAFAFVAEERDVGPAAPEPPRPGLSVERAAWAQALAVDTIVGYRRFLRDFPNGTYAPLAEATIEQMMALAEPVLSPRQTEEALHLTRDQRRSVQRNLTLLQYNTRGIDGIFGQGTRTAIAAWQRANGNELTSYLTREQVDLIVAQGTRRAAELEAQAAEQKAAAERADRAYWTETGSRGDEAGLRAYLRRYPEGLYAEVAKARLKPFDDLHQDRERAADRAAWERATEADTIDAYRQYLAAQRTGAYRDRAEQRIAELSRNVDDDAIRREEALGLNTITRNLVESRLDALGMNPGRVDGIFDGDTRRAIRRFQQVNGMPVTGYLTQDEVVRILASAILR